MQKSAIKTSIAETPLEVLSQKCLHPCFNLSDPFFFFSIFSLKLFSGFLLVQFHTPNKATVIGSNHFSNQTPMAPLLKFVMQCYKNGTEDSCPGTPICRKKTVMNEHHGHESHRYLRRI